MPQVNIKIMEAVNCAYSYKLPVLVSEQSVHLQRSICNNVLHYRQAKRSPSGICNLQVAQPEVFLDSRIQHQTYLGVISYNMSICHWLSLSVTIVSSSTRVFECTRANN
jgi:hypothetical protein